MYRTRVAHHKPFSPPIALVHPSHPTSKQRERRTELVEAEDEQRLVDLEAEDLGLDETLSRACQHPGNLWSLHGLHECLTKRDETVEALHIKQQLDQALARAEVAVHASCYCRQQAAA